MAETHRDLEGNIVGGSLRHVEQTYWCEGQKNDNIGYENEMR